MKNINEKVITTPSIGMISKCPWLEMVVITFSWKES